MIAWFQSVFFLTNFVIDKSFFINFKIFQNHNDEKKEKIITLLNKNKNEGKIVVKEQIDETKTIFDWSKILTGVSDLSTIVSNIFQIIN